jgi:hypothetical protein
MTRRKLDRSVWAFMPEHDQIQLRADEDFEWYRVVGHLERDAAEARAKRRTRLLNVVTALAVVADTVVIFFVAGGWS